MHLLTLFFTFADTFCVSSKDVFLVVSQLISDCKLDCSIPSVLFDKNLYFLVQYQLEGKIWIIKFDTTTEEFIKMSSLPFGNRMTEYVRFVVHKGCLYLCPKYGVRKKDKWRIELWKMSGDGKHWTNVATYWPKTRKPLSLKTGKPLSLQPVHLMCNGNWLMYDYEGHLYVVDPSTKKHVNEADPILVNNDWLDIPEEGKYIETFVSPNRYIK
ncbi:F-box/kelch-repeat protein-like protein [Tanacetum coccineum]